MFREACRLGCEGIVSKRLGSIYHRGRSPYWIKVKNPKSPAVTREAEEDWSRRLPARRLPSPWSVVTIGGDSNHLFSSVFAVRAVAVDVVGAEAAPSMSAALEVPMSAGLRS